MWDSLPPVTSLGELHTDAPPVSLGLYAIETLASKKNSRSSSNQNNTTANNNNNNNNSSPPPALFACVEEEGTTGLDSSVYGDLIAGTDNYYTTQPQPPPPPPPPCLYSSSQESMSYHSNSPTTTGGDGSTKRRRHHAASTGEISLHTATHVSPGVNAINSNNNNNNNLRRHSTAATVSLPPVRTPREGDGAWVSAAHDTSTTAADQRGPPVYQRRSDFGASLPQLVPSPPPAQALSSCQTVEQHSSGGGVGAAAANYYEPVQQHRSPAFSSEVVAYPQAFTHESTPLAMPSFYAVQHGSGHHGPRASGDATTSGEDSSSSPICVGFHTSNNESIARSFLFTDQPNSNNGVMVPPLPLHHPAHLSVGAQSGAESFYSPTLGSSAIPVPNNSGVCPSALPAEREVEPSSPPSPPQRIDLGATVQPGRKESAAAGAPQKQQQPSVVPAATTDGSAAVTHCIQRRDEFLRIFSLYRERHDQYQGFKNQCTEGYLMAIERSVDKYLVKHYNPPFSAASTLSKAGAKILQMGSTFFKNATSAAGGGSTGSPSPTPPPPPDHAGGAGRTNGSGSGSGRGSGSSHYRRPTDGQQQAMPQIQNQNSGRRGPASPQRAGSSARGSVASNGSSNNGAGRVRGSGGQQQQQQQPLPMSADGDGRRPTHPMAPLRYTSDVIPDDYLDVPPSPVQMAKVRDNYPILQHALRHVLPCTAATRSSSPTSASSSETEAMRTELLLPTIERVWREYLAPLEERARELLNIYEVSVAPSMNRVVSASSAAGNAPASDKELQRAIQFVTKLQASLQGDLAYIHMIRTMDSEFVSCDEQQQAQMNARINQKKLSDYVPVYGLILSRLHRLEMEHRTVLEVWGGRVGQQQQQQQS